MCRTVIAAVLALAASAVALELPDAPGDISSGPRVVGQSDRDRIRPETQRTPASACAMIEQMSPAERKNACISVEFESSDAELLALGREVEQLWNGGRYDEALAKLGNLEARIGFGRVAIGNSWRTPVPTFKTEFWDADVRIGNRDSLLDLAFDTHLSSNNLFVAFRHGGGEAQKMSVCMSSDGGATWRETYSWNGTLTMMSLDAAVLANHVYVAYAMPSSPNEVRVRRLKYTDGSSDTFNNGAQYVVACTLAVGDTVGEVSLVSTQHSNNVRLYMTTLVSDGSIACCWDDTTALSWRRVATGITAGADHGLDATENQGNDSTYLFFSYYDTSDSLRIYGRANNNFKRRYTRYAGAGEITSISAYEDTVICAFDDETASPFQVVYVINYSGSASWGQGTLSDSDTTAEAPGVTARGGGGLAAVFRHYTPTRELRFLQRVNYGPGPWTDPVSIADVDPYWYRPGIEYLGTGVFGVAFLSGSPVERGAYFDRSDWPTGLAEQRRLIVDENVLNVTPNPLSGRGQLNYTLNRAADLRVQVYDRAGRVVRTLFEGRSAAGRQSFGFGAAGMAPGVYFVRADADGRALTVPMTVVK